MLVRRLGVRPKPRALLIPLAASAVLALVLVTTPGSLVVLLPLGALVYLAVSFVLARVWAPEQLHLLRRTLGRGGDR